jgi:ABC-type amino acid transport substrate-binding protein
MIQFSLGGDMVSHNHLTLNSLCLLVFFFISQPIHAVLDNNTYSMATLEQIPYGFKTFNGQIKGGLFDVMNEIIKESGLKASNQLLSASRLNRALNQGSQLCTLATDTAYAIRNFDLIEPIGLTLPAGIIPRKTIRLPSYASLKNIIIAVPLGIYFDKKFDKDKTLTKIHPLNYSNAIHMLKYEQVDAIAGAIDSLLYIAKHGSMSESDFSPPLVLSNREIYLTCNKDAPSNVRSALRTAIITLKKEGKIKKIQKKYLNYNNHKISLSH